MRLRQIAAVAVLSAGMALPMSATALAAPDRDCSDFATQAEAQAAFEADGPGDPEHLDADHDGKACEDLTPGGSESPVVSAPVGGVPAGDGSTSDDGPLRIALGGMGLVAAGGAAFAARRAARGRP
jgi:hypothetical protein